MSGLPIIATIAITVALLIHTRSSEWQFHRKKQKEKKLVFEFNDVRTSAPISSVSESPVSKFVVEQRAIDINKDIRGLKAEFHSQVRVTFTLDKIPDIHVNDQSNVILFSYKWSTNPNKAGAYVFKTESKKATPYIIGGAAAVVVGAGAAVLLGGKKTSGPSADQPLDASDLPGHPATP